MPPNDLYIGSEYKRRGSPTKEIGALPIRREIQEPEGYVRTPRDKDLRHSVFGPVVIIPRRLHQALENRVVRDGRPDHDDPFSVGR